MIMKKFKKELDAIVDRLPIYLVSLYRIAVSVTLAGGRKGWSYHLVGDLTKQQHRLNDVKFLQ